MPIATGPGGVDLCVLVTVSGMAINLRQKGCRALIPSVTGGADVCVCTAVCVYVYVCMCLRLYTPLRCRDLQTQVALHQPLNGGASWETDTGKQLWSAN